LTVKANISDMIELFDQKTSKLS